MRARATLVLAIAALSALSFSSCLGAGDFHCGEHRQCGAGAFCEIDGRCSVPAPDCPSRRRYVRNAGPMSDACVPESCAANSVSAISAGGTHACTVRADGGVQCWGRNDDGQLGDGTRTSSGQPVRVAGLDDARAVAAGQRHTCAVRLGGQVVCWGANEAGQLGNGVGTGVEATALTPVAVANVTSAVSVAAGLDFSCAVLADGTALCWGADDVGQLGDGGAAAATHLPSPVFGLIGIRTVSASWQHACAVRDNGTLWCWGANGFGQLGDGSTTDQPRPVRVTTLSQVTAAGAGGSHTCAVTQAAGLYCWGSNSVGQLGTTAQGPITSPLRVPVVSDPVAVAAGLEHTCAVRNAGDAVYCWGQNDRGQLGDGTMTALSSPVPVELSADGGRESVGLETATAVTAGAAFSCALTVDGAVFCWGDNHHGQLATGGGTLRVAPTPVPTAVNATAIAAGGAHTCATIANRAGSTAIPEVPLCWGAGQAGQLGDGAATRIDRPYADAVKAEVRATAIAAGGAHTCAIADDKSVWCWGRGGAGQLGSGTAVDKTPTQVATLPQVTAVAAGTAHTCAIAANRVRCFGANANGQLGDGTTADRSDPPAAAPLGAAPATPVSVTAGGAHTCAIDDGGKVWCWGKGEEGAVGDDTGMDRLSPVMVPLDVTDASARAISAGGAHTCAVTTTGQVTCWGRGREGQLGSGGTTAAWTPTAVPAISDAVDVAAGAAHTCVIAGTDRTVWCWGANDFGQLGNGMTDAAPTVTPAPVAGLKDVRALSAGTAHTCALRSDGAVWCWGADTSGQLGDGVPLAISTPQLARLTCQ